jgi:hypothetical protein
MFRRAFDLELFRRMRRGQASRARRLPYVIDSPGPITCTRDQIPVKIKSAPIINGCFEIQKSAISGQFFAESGQFQTPGSGINRNCVNYTCSLRKIHLFLILAPAAPLPLFARLRPVLPLALQRQRWMNLPGERGPHRRSIHAGFPLQASRHSRSGPRRRLGPLYREKPIAPFVGVASE